MNFLKRVEDTVCDQLKRNLESHAFDGKCIQTLYNDNVMMIE